MKRYLLAITLLLLYNTAYCPAKGRIDKVDGPTKSKTLHATIIPILPTIEKKSGKKEYTAINKILKKQGLNLSVRKIEKCTKRRKIAQLPRCRTIELNPHNIPLGRQGSVPVTIEEYLAQKKPFKAKALPKKEVMPTTLVGKRIAQLLVKVQSMPGLKYICTPLKTALTLLLKEDTPSRNRAYSHLARATKLIEKESEEATIKRCQISTDDLTSITSPSPVAPEPLIPESPTPLVDLPTEMNKYLFYGDGLELFGDLPPNSIGLPEIEDITTQNIFW